MSSEKYSKVSVIYLITCKVNKKIYVGSAVDFYQRRASHKWAANSKKGEKTLIGRAMHKYGWDAFEFTILEEIKERSDLLIREQYWIDRLNPFGNIGYNLARTTQNARRKLKNKEEYSQLRREISLKYGQATRERSSRPVYQIDPTTLTIIKEYPSITEADRAFNLNGCVGNVCKKRIGCRTAGGFYWSYKDVYDKEGFSLPSYEERKRTSQASVIRPVYQKTEDGIIVEIWQSTADAARAFKVNLGTISKACQLGKRCKQYRWEYVTDPIVIEEIRRQRAKGELNNA